MLLALRRPVSDRVDEPSDVTADSASSVTAHRGSDIEKHALWQFALRPKTGVARGEDGSPPLTPDGRSAAPSVRLSTILWHRKSRHSRPTGHPRPEENLAIDALSIRPIGPQDAEQLGELFVGLAAGPEAEQFHPHPLTADEARRIADGSATRKDAFFAAFLGDRLAGYAMLRGWDEGYSIPSFGVAVGAPYRSAGLGRSLLRYAIELARERGAATLMLKVHLDNPSARDLYESEGFVFQEIPEDPRQIKGLLAL